MNPLIRQKQDLAFPGLTVLKYDQKVFYKNLWNTDESLLECRGHVINDNGEYVARPFKKVFNHKENNADIPKDQVIHAVRKMNGFMLHATVHNNTDGSILVGTTGSLWSEFVKLGRYNLIKHNIAANLLMPLYTYIFEIVDNEVDPHIVNDEDGVYLLGIRNVKTGELLSQEECDLNAKIINAKRPEWKECTFKQILREVKEVTHEGFMIYNSENNDCILKIKSPYYLSKKWVMRKNADRVFEQDYRTLVDEEYFPIIDIIRKYYPKNVWVNISEQDKGEVFTKILQEL